MSSLVDQVPGRCRAGAAGQVPPGRCRVPRKRPRTLRGLPPATPGLGDAEPQCTPLLDLGEDCEPGLQCHDDLACLEGKCAAPLAKGAACTDILGQCDKYAGAACDPTTSVCTVAGFAAAGEACGLPGNGLFLCQDADCLPSLLFGPCTEKAPDGAACDFTNGPLCQLHSAGIGGVCRSEWQVLRKPTRTHPCPACARRDIRRCAARSRGRPTRAGCPRASSPTRPEWRDTPGGGMPDPRKALPRCHAHRRMVRFPCSPLAPDAGCSPTRCAMIRQVVARHNPVVTVAA